MENQVVSSEASLINIRDMLRAQSGKAARFIPGFVYGLARRIMHEDDMNEIIAANNHLRDMEWVRAGLDMMRVRIELRGEENLPVATHNVFIGNHPLGAVDGLWYFSILGERYANVRSISNQLLSNFPNIAGLYIPLNMLGNRSRNMLKAVDDLYASEYEVLHFPAGRVSRKEHGVVQDLEWAKSFVTKSIQHKRRIVPAFISGHNSALFYGIAQFRKILGIKQPYELFLLVHEAFRQRGNTLQFTFGKPVEWQVLTRERRPEEWSQLLREYVYSLEKEPSVTFDDILSRHPLH